MIQRRSNSLGFETDAGVIPCAVDDLAIELVGDAVVGLSAEVVREIALGLLRYFRDELGREQITVGEFAEALETVLRGFGFDLPIGESAPPASEATATPVASVALDELLAAGDIGLAAGFFPRLRRELHRRMDDEPRVIRFTGLRPCVKRLSGARRWNRRCQRLRDQIVGYLRLCIAEKPMPGHDCAVLVT